MSSTINITFGNETVGSVQFTQPEIGFGAVRTAAGFRVQIPTAITFSPPSGSGLPLTLENLRLTVHGYGADKQIENWRGLLRFRSYDADAE